MKIKKTPLLKTKNLIVKKKDSLENQLGVFTKKSFYKNQKIFIIKGPIRSKPSIYSFSINLSKHIEPQKEKGGFNFGHYLNHSCNPNTIIKIINENKKNPYLKVIARRNIKKDEELTFDYASLEYITVSGSICKCNTKNCRGIIHGFRDLPESFVRKYQKEGMIPKYLFNIKRN